jgi:hypothetical protein
MKKLYNVFFWLVAIMVWSAPVVLAANVEVRPEVVARMYDGADQALGGGINLDVKELFPNKNIVVTGGFESISTEIDSRSEGADVDIVSSKIAVGYDYALLPGLTARPYVGLDFAFINGEDSRSKNEIGRSIGVNVTKDLNDRAAAFLGLGYQFMDTRIDADKVDLSNLNWKAGVSVKF